MKKRYVFFGLLFGALAIAAGETQFPSGIKTTAITGTGTATLGNIIDSGLTATTVPYLNGSKQLTSSAVTPTELALLSGATSIASSVGNFSSTPTAKGLDLTAGVITLHAADDTHAGAMSTGAQSFAGNKTFSGIVQAGSFSGTLFGDQTSGSIDASTIASSGTATLANIIDSGLTATTVPYVNGSKQFTSSAVTPTELGYVHNVTSAIQTQIDAIAGGATSVGNFSSSSTAKGLDITSNVLTLHAASASNAGAVSTGTQTLAGDKTFAGTTSFASRILPTEGAVMTSSTDKVALSVTGNGTQTNNVVSILKSDTSPLFVVTNSKVGIGPQAPDMELSVDAGGSDLGATNIADFYANAASAASGGLVFSAYRDSGTVANRYGSIQSIDSGGTVRNLFLNRAGGNVGIGKVPTTALDVSGTTTSTAFAGPLTGAVTGNADTATALAANPSDCGADTYATTIAANGNLTCATVTNAGLAGSIADTKLSTIATAGKVSDSALPSSMATKTFTGVTTFPGGSTIDGSGNIGVGTAASAVERLQSSTFTTLTGTLTNSASGTAVTGTGTKFLTEVKAGMQITMNAETRTVASVPSDTSLTTDAWTGGNTGATATVASAANFYIHPNGNFQAGGTRTNITNFLNANNNYVTATANGTSDTTGPTAAFGVTMYSGAAAAGPLYFMMKSRGTETSPTTASSGDTLGTFSFRGYDSSIFTVGGATIQAKTTQAWTSANHGGQLLFNTTPNTGSSTPTLALTLDQDQSATFGGAMVNTHLSTGTNADTVCLSAGGTFLIQAAACTISKRALKEDIESLDGQKALDVILALNPVEFNFRHLGEENSDPNYYHRQAGFIAEEVADVDPALAVYEKDMKTPKSYRQEAIISKLVKAVQMQEKRIRELEDRLGYE